VREIDLYLTVTARFIERMQRAFTACAQLEPGQVSAQTAAAAAAERPWPG
jgi:hypothetical protein